MERSLLRRRRRRRIADDDGDWATNITALLDNHLRHRLKRNHRIIVARLPNAPLLTTDDNLDLATCVLACLLFFGLTHEQKTHFCTTSNDRRTAKVANAP